jgi:hypothetical protein
MSKVHDYLLDRETVAQPQPTPSKTCSQGEQSAPSGQAMVETRRYHPIVPFGFVYINDTRMKFSPAVIYGRKLRKSNNVLVLVESNHGELTTEETLACAKALQAEYPTHIIAIDTTPARFWLSCNTPGDTIEAWMDRTSGIDGE